MYRLTSIVALTVFATMSPADEKVQLAAQRTRSANNLKQIGLALHNYHDVNGGFPAAAICDRDGKPLLSWRVAILPYLEHEPLYKAFKLDEPWNSEHNQKLLERMPKQYAAVRGNNDNKYDTFYRVFQGGGALFEANKLVGLAKILDGSSNTIMAVEAGEAVPWTKPDVLSFDKSKPLPKLGGLFDGNFHVLMADGSVRMMSKTVDLGLLRKLITKAGLETIDR